VPEFTESESWPPNSPDFNPVDYSVWGMLHRWCIVAEFQILTTTEMCVYRLSDSAKPEHIEPSDQLTVKKSNDGYRGEGCPY